MSHTNVIFLFSQQMTVFAEWWGAQEKRNASCCLSGPTARRHGWSTKFALPFIKDLLGYILSVVGPQIPAELADAQWQAMHHQDHPLTAARCINDDLKGRFRALGKTGVNTLPKFPYWVGTSALFTTILKNTDAVAQLSNSCQPMCHVWDGCLCTGCF